MADNLLVELSIEFAVKIVKMTDNVGQGLAPAISRLMIIIA